MNKPHPHTDRILRVIDYIHDHAAEDLSLDQLADVAAMSRFHWHRVFTAVMGASPAVMIRSVRLHKATMLLVRTTLPIPDVATRVGYPNDRSFARAFKDTYAITPSAFRKRGTINHTQTHPKGDTPMFDVTIRSVPMTTIAGLTHIGPYADGSVAYQKVATIITTGGHWSDTRGMAGVYDPMRVLFGQAVICRMGLTPRTLRRADTQCLRSKGHIRDCLRRITIFTGHGLLRLKNRCATRPPLRFI